METQSTYAHYNSLINSVHSQFQFLTKLGNTTKFFAFVFAYEIFIVSFIPLGGFSTVVYLAISLIIAYPVSLMKTPLYLFSKSRSGLGRIFEIRTWIIIILIAGLVLSYDKSKNILLPYNLFVFSIVVSSLTDMELKKFNSVQYPETFMQNEDDEKIILVIQHFKRYMNDRIRFLNSSILIVFLVLIIEGLIYLILTPSIFVGYVAILSVLVLLVLVSILSYRNLDTLKSKGKLWIKEQRY